MHLALGTSRNSNRDVSHRRILGVLYGQSQKKTRYAPYFAIIHTKEVIWVNKGFEVGSDGPLKHSLEARLTAGMLHQRKGVKFFLYSGKFRK